MGSEVTQQRAELEEAVQQARKLERDASTSHKLLLTTEEHISKCSGGGKLQQADMALLQVSREGFLLLCMTFSKLRDSSLGRESDGYTI